MREILGRAAVRVDAAIQFRENSTGPEIVVRGVGPKGVVKTTDRSRPGVRSLNLDALCVTLADDRLHGPIVSVGLGRVRQKRRGPARILTVVDSDRAAIVRGSSLPSGPGSVCWRGYQIFAGSVKATES
jgi:hypothetical protein